MATFTRRGKSWRVQVFRRGVRQGATFQTKAAAETWARRVESEIENGHSRDRVPSRETLGALIMKYVREVKPVRPWGRTKDDCLARLIREIGHLKIGVVSHERIIEYARKRSECGAGPVTVQMEMVYLGKVLRVARSVWRIDIPRDTMADVQESLKLLGLVGRSKKRDRLATDLEINRIKNEWNSEVPVEIIDFAYDSCMRLGEICRITWDDLDGDVIVIRDRKHPTDKIGNDQRVPLLGRCPEILAALARTSDRVWPYPEDTVGTAWRRARDAAGVLDLRFHDLRHTGITRLFQLGFRIEQVAIVSGHRDWTMLKRYTHIRAEDLLANQKPDSRTAA